MGGIKLGNSFRVGQTMTGADLKELRHFMGLSLSEMALLLGFSKEDRERHLRRIEDGERPVSGTVSNLAQMIWDKHREKIS